MIAKDMLNLLWNILDVLLVAYIVYRILLLLKGTRAQQMLVGLIVIITVFFITDFLKLNTLNWFLSGIIGSIVLVVIVLFQDEIRRGLVQVGKKSILLNQETINKTVAIEEIIKAAGEMASKKTGALIILEQRNNLDNNIEIGTIIDSDIKSELLQSIFQQNSPLHDGAVVVRNVRIFAAGCILPISTTPDVIKKIGTRHRAALGISEITDAVAIVVSEETGSISFVTGGEIHYNLTSSGLRQFLIVTLELAENKDEA